MANFDGFIDYLKSVGNWNLICGFLFTGSNENSDLMLSQVILMLLIQ